MMSLDKSRIPKLSDSSRKFIPKKQKKSMNDPFVERTVKNRNKKGKKIISGMVETKSQNASEDEKAMLEVEIHPNQDRDGSRTETDGSRRI